MAALIYTRKSLMQRIRKHMNDSYANDSYTVSDNELEYYLDQSIAFAIIGQVYQNAKVENALVVPDAYQITYLLTSVKQDPVTNYFYTTLPQPPLSLPAGYDINSCYVVTQANGIAYANRIKSKRLAFRNNMPFPTGFSFWVENATLWLRASDGTSLLTLPVYVQMPSARTTDINTPMNIPDDAIEIIFTKTVEKLIQRYQQPKDIIVDRESSGNKTS